MALLEVKNLTKRYESFNLEDVNFTIEPGYIIGFIGRNGAGKSTTLKSILNLTQPESGEIKFFGLDLYAHEIEIKQRIGVIFGEFDYYRNRKLKDIKKVVEKFYLQWDENKYKRYTELFKLDEGKCIKQLSVGMRVKFALALALSHNAELLILDEPTSGLDPVSRDELIKLFKQIVSDGKCSILFSTQITSDLDKCADYILYIKNGKILMQGDVEQVISGYRLINGTHELLTDSLKQKLIGYEENAFGFTGLIKDDDIELNDGLRYAVPDIESIMLFNEM